MPVPNDIGNQRWRPFKNTGEQEVPAFGALEIDGMTTRTVGGFTVPVLSAKRPTSGSLPGAAVNSHLPVPVGAYGECTFDFPTWALYDTGSTPTYGENWGTAANLFTLSQGNTGFTIIGGETDGRVYVERVSSSGVTSKILYLPLQMESNYVLPQDFETGTAVGYEWSISATNYSNIDFDTEYDIKDYYGSIGLPGQTLTCVFNSTLNAWTPMPPGQNALQLARTYKTIPANSTVTGDDIFLCGFDGTNINGDILEMSNLVNDTLTYDHATSGTDIEGTLSDPVEILIYLFHTGNGAEWRVIGRACNPQQ